MNVYLAGEGRAELGSWERHQSYRGSTPEPGLLEALLRRVKPDGWTVTNAICWRSIPKYRAAHSRLPAEVANVLGLVLRAHDEGCDVVAFSRDRDGDPEREEDVRAGIERACKLFPNCPGIIGGVAIEAIESWIASLQGKRRAESSANPKTLLDEHNLDHMRAVVEGADLAKLSTDAQSLRRWLQNAADVLGDDTKHLPLSPTSPH